MTRDLVTLISQLIELIPETANAERHQHAVEHELMEALQSGGRQAGEALVGSLTDHGYELVHVAPCFWRVELPPPRVLELWFNPPDDPVIAAVSYRTGTPWGTTRQRRAAERQEAFFARYEKLIPLDEAQIDTLSLQDRLVLFIGEFEADVNNGGFGQYLDNKGEDCAKTTLRLLVTIGARRTARWLSAAIEATGNPQVLERLDRAFFETPEDLASLVMRHIARQSPPLAPPQSG